mgnify:CR=1 FL=1
MNDTKIMSKVDSEFEAFKKSVEELKYIENDLKDILMKNSDGGFTREKLDNLLIDLENKTRYDKDYFLFNELIEDFENGVSIYDEEYIVSYHIEDTIIPNLSEYQKNYMLDRFFYNDESASEIFYGEHSDNRDKLLYLWDERNHSTEESQKEQHKKYMKYVDEYNFLEDELRDYLKSFMNNPKTETDGIYVDYIIDDYILEECKKYNLVIGEMINAVQVILFKYEEDSSMDSHSYEAKVDKAVDEYLEDHLSDFDIHICETFYSNSHLEVQPWDVENVEGLLSTWKERKI